MTTALKPLYGRAFDFRPSETPPRVRYVLMTTPRSGSTFLSLALWDTQGLGAPLEYLNLDRLSRRMRIEEPRVFARYWSSIKRRRTSPNGVFGVKLFANFAYAIQSERAALFHELFRDGRAIRLVRRDRIAQAVSLARARQTQRWYAGDAQMRAPDYDFARVAASLQRIDAFEAWWDRLAGSLPTPPLQLVYEDVIAAPQAAIAAVAGHLGVALPQATNGHPQRLQLATQRDEVSAHWCARFHDESQRERRAI